MRSVGRDTYAVKASPKAMQAGRKTRCCSGFTVICHCRSLPVNAAITDLVTDCSKLYCILFTFVLLPHSTFVSRRAAVAAYWSLLNVLPWQVQQERAPSNNDLHNGTGFYVFQTGDIGSLLLNNLSAEHGQNACDIIPFD